MCCLDELRLKFLHAYQFSIAVCGLVGYTITSVFERRVNIVAVKNQFLLLVLRLAI